MEHSVLGVWLEKSISEISCPSKSQLPGQLWFTPSPVWHLGVGGGGVSVVLSGVGFLCVSKSPRQALSDLGITCSSFQVHMAVTSWTCESGKLWRKVYRTVAWTYYLNPLKIEGTTFLHFLTSCLVRYLGEVKLLTTSCCITELEKLGPPVYGAMMVAKGFPVFKCGHKTPQPANSCILSLLGAKNSQHFIVASQDNELRWAHVGKFWTMFCSVRLLPSLQAPI